MKDFIRVNYNDEYDMLLHVPSHNLMRVKTGQELDYDRLSSSFEGSKVAVTLREINRDLPLSGLIFNTTERCNLRCSYCMVNKGTYHGDNTKISLEPEDYDRTYDFMFRNYPKGTTFVCFFGGEPMLRKEEIKYAVRELEKRNAEKNLPAPRYSIITNGTLMDDEILEFMDEHHMYMSVSIDGYKEIHDSARVFANGKGSYDNIADNLEKLKERGREFPLYAEATVHKEHIIKSGEDKRKGGYEFVKRLYDLGFDAVYVFPVESDDESISIDSVPFSDLRDFFYGVYDYYMELLLDENPKAKAPGHFIGLFGNILGKRQNRTCNAGSSTIFVNPQGDVYPCHLLYNAKYQKIGNIHEGLISQERMETIFHENDKERIAACKTCPNRTLCFLWCPGSSMLCNGEIDSVVRTRCKVVDLTVKYVVAAMGEIMEEGKTKKFKKNFRESLTEYRRF